MVGKVFSVSVLIRITEISENLEFKKIENKTMAMVDHTRLP